MAKSKSSSSSGSRFGTQIQAETQLRYQPQVDALAALLKQAVSDRTQGLQVQDTVRRGLIDSARGAVPQAGQSLQSALGTIDTALQGVPLQGLAASDVAATKTRLADQMARTATELTSRQNDAAAAYGAGVRQVNSQYESDRSKIADQLQSLTGQEGTFGASRLAELLTDDRKMRHDTNQQARQQAFQAGENDKSRAVTLRGQDLTHDDKERSARKAKWATPEQQGAFEDDLGAAIAQAKKLQAAGRDRHEVAALLVNGRPGQTIIDPKSGQSVNVPGVPKTKELVASVALDAVYDGHISKQNVQRVHQRRYKVKSLGIPTKAPATPSKIPAPPAPQFPANISPFTPLGG